MKKSRVLIVAAAVSLACSFPSLAGEWKQDDRGWWYDNGDSGWEHSGWKWINGRCYYFTPEGYCLQNTTTPDGYLVNEDGAWTLDGIVQERDGQGMSWVVEVGAGRPLAVGSLSIHTPAGFQRTSLEENACLYEDSQRTRAIAAVSRSAQELEVFDQAAYAGFKSPVLDYAMTAALGQYTLRTDVTLNTGAWTRYDYDSLPGQTEVPDTLTAYLRLQGTEIQMVVFAGDFGDTDTDGLMNQYVK